MLEILFYFHILVRELKYGCIIILYYIATWADRRNGEKNFPWYYFHLPCADDISSNPMYHNLRTYYFVDWYKVASRSPRRSACPCSLYTMISKLRILPTQTSPNRYWIKYYNTILCTRRFRRYYLHMVLLMLHLSAVWSVILVVIRYNMKINCLKANKRCAAVPPYNIKRLGKTRLGDVTVYIIYGVLRSWFVLYHVFFFVI